MHDGFLLGIEIDVRPDSNLETRRGRWFRTTVAGLVEAGERTQASLYRTGRLYSGESLFHLSGETGQSEARDN